MTLAPRQKLIGAALLALAVPVIAALQGASATNAARAVLAVASLAGLAAWFLKARGPSKFKSAPRLTVIQRVGLAPRTGMALVEVDGRPYLVVHGDGYAKLTPARRAKVVSP